MYELTNGSARLVSVLSSYREDPESIKALARILNYHEEQLNQDIKALEDYYNNTRKERN